MSLSMLARTHQAPGRGCRVGQKQHDWKPIPLRPLTLATFAFVLLGSIGLIELLLRSTSSTMASSTTTSSAATTALRPRQTSHFRPKRHPEVSIITARQDSLYDCGDAAVLSAEIASYKAASNSLCSTFTSSYQAHTANLSWPEQTAVSQWLFDYSAVSSASVAASKSSSACEYFATVGTSTSKFYAVEGTYVSSVDILCSTTVMTLDWNVCIVVWSASIESFSLTSGANSLCGANVGAVAWETTPTWYTDPPPETSGVNTRYLITPVIPVDNVPTVTIAAGAPAETPKQTLPTVTKPGSVAGAGDGATVAAVTPAPTNPAVTVAPVPIPITYTITDGNGQLRSVVTQVHAVPGSDATVVITNPQGLIETFAAEASATSGPSASVVLTDPSGAVKTIVANIHDLVRTTSTYLSTDSLGEVHTMTTVLYALTGPYNIYLTTGSDGILQTAISKLTSGRPSFTTTAQYTGLVTTINADGSVSSFSAVVVQNTVFPSSPVADTALATKTNTTPHSKATGPTNFTLSSYERIVEGKYGRAQYFMAMYLPAIIAVLIKVFWEMVFAAIKLMEPFERLANATGANARYTVFAEYLSSSMSVDVFTSLRHSNPLPLLSGILYLLVHIGAPLAAASMTIRSRSTCLIDGQYWRCDPVWIINIRMLRGVEVVTALGFLLIIVVLWTSHRRRSGIIADPSSLASIAFLTNHEQLITDICEVGPDASHNMFENALDQHTFLLDYHKISDSSCLYGILGLRYGSEPSFPELGARNLSTIDSAAPRHSHRSLDNPANTATPASYSRTTTRSKLRQNLTTDLLGLLCASSLLAIVVSFYLDNKDDVFNRFFNSRSPWPKILLVGIATVTSMFLSRLERLVRITEPFRRLAESKRTGSLHNSSRIDPLESTSDRRQSSNSETTLLITRSGTAYSNIPQCLMLLVGSFPTNLNMSVQLLISLTVFASDLNILAVAGVAFSDALIWEAYQISITATIALTSFIVLVQILVVAWWRQTPAVHVLGGTSISKGVGTIGGCMRWLLSGGTGALEAVVRVGSDGQIRKSWAGPGRRHSITDTRIWFGRTGEIGSDGQERWALMTRPREARQEARNGR